MAAVSAPLRMYTDLAPWWPLLSPPEDYAEEAAFIGDLLATAQGDVREVLELGSGGGHTAVHLARRFTMTLSDLSAEMLAVSRRLHPGAAHHQGDMRTLRLGRRFDAVLVHDAVDYMAGEADLAAAMATAYEHCRPGGVAVFVPDHIRETFEPGTEHGGTDAADGRGLRYLEWCWDPDPAGTRVQTLYVIAVRGTDGAVDVVHESHETGLFPEATWLRLLGEAGFGARAVTEATTQDRAPRRLFVGHRPAGAVPQP